MTENPSDHDLLITIAAELTGMRSTLGAFALESSADRRHIWDMKADKDSVIDHEERLRRNERMIYIGLGGLMTIQIVFALLAHFLKV